MLNQLRNIGLSDKEARVYLAMLELGPSPVLEISAKAGINRPNTYVQIEFLKKRGLVTTQTKSGKQLFAAESPDQLETIIAREKKLLEEKDDELKKILPDLETLYNLAEEKPQVKFFEGKEGLLRMQGEFLKTKEKQIFAITSIDDVLNVFPTHQDSYSSKRVQKKIYSKLIYTSNRGDFLKEHDKKMLRESKYVSPEKLNFTSDITIYGNTVAIASLKGKLSGVIIEHKDIAQSFKGLFDFNWNLVDKI